MNDDGVDFVRSADDEEDVGFAGLLAANRRDPVALAAARRQRSHLDRKLERVAGNDLAAEARAVDATEERELPGVALVGEDGAAADLGE